nr:MAG: hypothetical protein [Molluscum contagiosum virus]
MSKLLPLKVTMKSKCRSSRRLASCSSTTSLQKVTPGSSANSSGAAMRLQPRSESSGSRSLLSRLKRTSVPSRST